MRKSDREMIAEMFSMLSAMTILLLYEDNEEKKKEMVYVRDELQKLVKKINVWVEEE